VNSDTLKQYLKKEGATLVGIGDVTEALSAEILHLNRGIAIAINRSLNRESVEILSGLQMRAKEWLRSRGYLNLVIPPDSDRRKDKLITKLYKLFCHKTAATCSGLGWVGKNGLLINRQYGSKLCWATVLTNAPFDPDEPIRESECGDCELCVTHCPSGAIKGDHWSAHEHKKKIVAYEKCAALKNDRHLLKDKPNCGFCVTVCPYSRKNGDKG
jgi:epoxyqueuosine reductase